MIKEYLPDLRLLPDQNCKSKVEDELRCDFLVDWQFFIVDHLLEKLAFMFVDGPILLLAILGAVIETFALRTRYSDWYHLKVSFLRRHQLHTSPLRFLSVAQASGSDWMILQPALRSLIATNPRLLGYNCLSSNSWFIDYSQGGQNCHYWGVFDGDGDYDMNIDD